MAFYVIDGRDAVYNVYGIEFTGLYAAAHADASVRTHFTSSGKTHSGVAVRKAVVQVFFLCQIVGAAAHNLCAVSNFAGRRSFTELRGNLDMNLMRSNRAGVVFRLS
ncbi:hypothetical protein SDC9_182534 [bioreactor metagenome]|uniref:Uncharacterized protein n=1 Tax=bioreactor metagenome TaxID=1076179 RepID=A0A645H8L6_9ZZZZ